MQPWWRRWTEQAFWLAGVVLPVFAALTRVASESCWTDDLPTVRALGMVTIGWPTSLSTLVMQATSLLPIGALPLRAAVGSALLLAVVSALIQGLSKRVLEQHVTGSFLNAPLAAIAALTATLGPSLQREGTVGGSNMCALAVSLGALWAVVSGLPNAQRLGVTAMLIGAVASESPHAAVLTAIACASVVIASRQWPSRRELAIAAIALVAVVVVVALPTAVRPSSPNAMMSLGRSLSSRGLVALDTAAKATTALTAWHAEVGTISLGLAALGAVIGLYRKRTRVGVVAVVVVVAADVIFPASSGAVLSPDALAPIRMLAVAAVSVCAAFGVQTVATTLIDMKLPMARAGAALLVMFNLTLVAVAAEQSAFTVDRTQMRGAAVFVDEALEKLEPGAMVLTRSHAVMWRLLSARVVSGTRPDVLVVPLPLLNRGQVAAQLLSIDPSVALLLRDVAISGTPGEHAVSRLADRRPLYVELDPAWDAKVAGHLSASGLWLRLTPQPTGPSDRKLSVTESRKAFDKVMASSRLIDDTDRATFTMAMITARQQAMACAMVGDKKASRTVLERIAAYEPNSLFVRDMTQRLDHAKGNVDVRGLLP